MKRMGWERVGITVDECGDHRKGRGGKGRE